MALSDRDFLGLEVVSLDEAAIVGTVQGLVVDDEAREVAALVVDVGEFRHRVVPYAAVRSVGVDAVVVGSGTDAVLVTEAPRLEELARRDVHLPGCFALTDDGVVLGVVDEFYVDEATGKITDLRIEPDEDEEGEPLLISADLLRKVGEEIVLLGSADANASAAAPQAVLDSDLVGLHIVSRAEAAVVGEVHALIIDDEHPALAGFVVNVGLHEPLALPREAATVIGPHAVLVDSASALQPLSTNPVLSALADRRAGIRDARAVTVSGKAVGTISHLYFDSFTGAVVGLQFVPGVLPADRDESLLLPLSCVVKLGKGLAVVSDDYADCLLPSPELGSQSSASSPSSAAGSPAISNLAGAPATRDQAQATAAAAPALETTVATSPDTPPLDATGESAAACVTRPAAEPMTDTSVDTATRHFLLGKHLLRRIELPSGEILAEAGDTVTAELIARVKEHNLLLVLSLNVE